MNNKLRNLIRLNNNIYRCTQSYVDKKLEKYNLTIGTYPYLLMLIKKPGISQNEASRELNVDKAMSARAIKRLIEFGYVRKEENKEDSRCYKLYITESGEKITPEVIKIINEWVDILLEGNNKDNIEKSISFLEGILKNAKKYRKNQCERMSSE